MVRLSLPVILASGSPRRKELLEYMGVPYAVDVSEADESFSGSPEETVKEISRRKAQAVAARHPGSLILAADTLVFLDSPLGKPHTEENAKKMLRMLSGKWHSVYSGVTILNTANGKQLQGADCTRVHFVELSEEDIDDYVRTGEPLDKAGAYGIQAGGGAFIDRIEGSYSNVVGLPMTLVSAMLREIEK